MSLTREQYDEIMRGYMLRQSRSRQLSQQRRDEIYAKLGEKGAGRSVSPLSVRSELDQISEQKKRLLREHGYPEDYLDEKYECPLCRDTGYIGNQKVYEYVINSHHNLI